MPSFLVEFRKRLNKDVMIEINEMIIEYNQPNDRSDDDEGDNNSAGGNDDIQIVDGYDTSQNSSTLIVDCIEVERKFSVDKRKLDFGLIRTKLKDTTKS